MPPAGTPAPRIRVRRATPDDAGAISKINFDAFGEEVMSRVLWPHGPSDDSQEKFARSLFPSPGEAADPSVEAIIMVAELLGEGAGEAGGAQGPEVVAFAQWKLVREEQPREKREAAEVMTEEDLGEGADAAVFNKFIGGLHEMRTRWVKGDAHLHLSLLVASPTRQRLGAGSALLRWGLELADRENKTTWLESSPAGYPLYRKRGFTDVDVQDLRLTELSGIVRSEGEDWGQETAVELAGRAPEGIFRSVLMKRLPKTA